MNFTFSTLSATSSTAFKHHAPTLPNLHSLPLFLMDFAAKGTALYFSVTWHT
jgi:hypothetical protein